jgi:hypothetical protein
MRIQKLLLSAAIAVFTTTPESIAVNNDAAAEVTATAVVWPAEKEAAIEKILTIIMPEISTATNMTFDSLNILTTKATTMKATTAKATTNNTTTTNTTIVENQTISSYVTGDAIITTTDILTGNETSTEVETTTVPSTTSTARPLGLFRRIASHQTVLPAGLTASPRRQLAAQRLTSSFARMALKSVLSSSPTLSSPILSSNPKPASFPSFPPAFSTPFLKKFSSRLYK